MGNMLRPAGRPAGRNRRRGAFLVLAFFSLVGAISFVALSVDLGMIALTKTRMQNAVDASALAAAQEITAAIENAGESVEGTEDVSGQVSDANAIAVEAAKEMAVKVGELNDVYIDAGQDVKFGKRIYNEGTGGFDIQWGIGPYNVVGVTARRDNATSGQPDSMLELFFAPFMGSDRVALSAEAVAFVEARDIVIVLDYSGSMSYDSQFRAMNPSKLGQPAVEANLDEIWDALVAAGPTFSNTSQSKFPSTGFGGINSAEGTYVSTWDDNDVFDALGLGDTDGSGNLLYPFPQEGRNSDGSLKGLPSASTSENLWKGYISWVQNENDVEDYGYQRKYGYRTLIGYLIEERKRNKYSEDLWRAPIYPFHAMKEGVSLFTEFLSGLDFGDYIGLVTYDSTSRVETGLDDDGVAEYVDLGAELITSNHEDIDTIQRHRQAGHYDVYTGIGYGVEDARELLESNGRYGARPTILIMTDGNANRSPSGWSLPGNWSWSELTDYDGNGSADYSTSNDDKQYAFWQVKQAVDAGYTVHTLTVGAGADRNLMEAIAFAGGGIWFDVPGGATVADMEDQMLEAFAKIAANVPPAKLLYDPSSGE